MTNRYNQLKHQLQSGDCHSHLVPEFSDDAIGLLVSIASAASDSEWHDFAANKFSLDSMPPILLTSRQMQMLRGGRLPAPSILIARLATSDES